MDLIRIEDWNASNVGFISKFGEDFGKGSIGNMIKSHKINLR